MNCFAYALSGALALAVTAQGARGQETGEIDPRVMAYFRSQYRKPVVGAIATDATVPLPGIRMYSVCEESQLVEDPLIPDRWAVTRQYRFFRAEMMHKAFEAERLAPANADQALAYAHAFLVYKEGSTRAVTDLSKLAHRLPAGVGTAGLLPEAREIPGGYRVTITFIMGDGRWCRIPEVLVRYTVEITGWMYRIESDESIELAEN